ncbi:hypothetical protein LAZ67_18000973 [Cordylochernes scorpioides]|uniref:Reverse transcriptase domain-containing protein n=1 Tax=Cordylochernes scorpioides TaxID=51811 RepID=A0ABY6LFQ3_9ARAC|nr:hypothetical protein LAZ67_18000973 [Cordylochernes scorpioides]
MIKLQTYLRKLYLQKGYPIDFIEKHAFDPCVHRTTTVHRATCWLPFSPAAVSISRFLRPYGIKVLYNCPPILATILRHQITKSDKPTLPIDSTGAIYSIQCLNCPTSYVGETGRTTGIRISEHRRNIRNKDLKSLIFTHISQTGHSFDLDHPQDIFIYLALCVLIVYLVHTSSNPPNNTQNSHPPATTQYLPTALPPPSPHISNTYATTHPSHSPAQTLPTHNNRPRFKHFDTKCKPFHLTLSLNNRCQSPLSSRLLALVPSNSISIPIMHTKLSRDKIIMHTNSKLNLDRLFKKFETATKNTDIQVTLPPSLKHRYTVFNIPDIYKEDELSQLFSSSLDNNTIEGKLVRTFIIDAHFILKVKIKKAIHDFQCCLLINLDIVSAFDQLWIPALSHRLHALNLPPSLLNMYDSFLVNRSATLTYRGHLRSVSHSRGCAQGSKSSPIL